MIMADDLVVLHKDLGLYLKPLAKVLITVILPEKKIVGKMISNWEVMETIKKKILPDVFLSLKVCTSSLAKVLLEAEVRSIEERGMVVKKLDKNYIKLSGFQDKFIMSAEPSKTRIIKRHDWELFFNQTPFDESERGERADTVHIEDLPVVWFKNSSKSIDQYILEIFSKFGKVCTCVIPYLDPYNDRINSVLENGYEQPSEGFRKTSFLSRGLMLDAYIQFDDQASFSKCIEAFNGMKMVRICPDDEEEHFCNYKLDFDRSKRLSAKVIEEREKIKQNLIESDRSKELESNAKKIEHDQLMEEERLAELKRIEEEEMQRKIEEQKKLLEDKLRIEEKKKKEQENYLRLVKDCEALENRILSVNDCRKYTALSILKTVLNKIKKELSSSSSKKRKSSAHSHHKIKKYR